MLDPLWLSRIDDPPSRQMTLERGGPAVARQRRRNLTGGRPVCCRGRQRPLERVAGQAFWRGSCSEQWAGDRRLPQARGPFEMATKLEKTIKRELELDGRLYTIQVGPDGLKVTEKGKRKGQELSWRSIISGDASLAQDLNVSVDATGGTA